MSESRLLNVFLCHASEDKPRVRKLYKRLKSESWIAPWLDEEYLLPGQDFDLEIYKATRDSDVIIICLSKVSVAKEGYVNKEIRRALDISKEKLEGTIYVIPLRLDECNPSFEQLKKLHWLDYFSSEAHEKLLKSLRVRADELKLSIIKHKKVTLSPNPASDDETELSRFVKIPQQKNSKIAYPFWIGKYPITNMQYKRFCNAPDFAKSTYWLEFPKFDENCKQVGDWGTGGLDWLVEQRKKAKTKVLMPRYWEDKNFGKSNPKHPVVGISWYEANAYCKWLAVHWKELQESSVNSGIMPKQIRLPVEIEWEIAAGGVRPAERYPWDRSGHVTTDVSQVIKRANVENKIGHTTPVNKYSEGISPYGVMDMAGNVWEWQANYYNKNHEWLILCGGSWNFDADRADVEYRGYFRPDDWDYIFGFRVLIPLLMS